MDAPRSRRDELTRRDIDVELRLDRWIHDLGDAIEKLRHYVPDDLMAAARGKAASQYNSTRHTASLPTSGALDCQRPARARPPRSQRRSGSGPHSPRRNRAPPPDRSPRSSRPRPPTRTARRHGAARSPRRTSRPTTPTPGPSSTW
ncbi:DUF6545 domain-containing protein [Streptomyces sp. NPDC102451]|uniref:DUF6545 domain-containing protein n=1 Tax=Streptomyces sp. NPDC102451 TaxID=3366177 RepID=UPI003829139C